MSLRSSQITSESTLFSFAISSIISSIRSNISSTSSLFVLTLIAGPLRSGLGSSLRFLAAALARPSFPKLCALLCGKHFGLPSVSSSLAQSPRILPSGPNRTHLSLNHLRKSSSTRGSFC